jgi:hypothetical protein
VDRPRQLLGTIEVTRCRQGVGVAGGCFGENGEIAKVVQRFTSVDTSRVARDLEVRALRLASSISSCVH